MSSGGITIKQIIPARNARFSINSGSSSSMLTVTTAEREDGGEYYCQVFLSLIIDPIRSSPHEIQIQGNKQDNYNGQLE